MIGPRKTDSSLEVELLQLLQADRDEARDVARRALDLLRRECGKTWMRPADMQLMRELEQMVGAWP